MPAPAPNQAPAQDNPYAAAAQALENTTETPAPAPVQSTSDKPARESHIPQEFDPSKFAPQAPYGNTNAMPPAPVAPTLSPVSVPPAVPSHVAPLPIAPPPLAPPMASTGTHINPAQVPKALHSKTTNLRTDPQNWRISCRRRRCWPLCSQNNFGRTQFKRH